MTYPYAKIFFKTQAFFKAGFLLKKNKNNKHKACFFLPFIKMKEHMFNYNHHALSVFMAFWLAEIGILWQFKPISIKGEMVCRILVWFH